MSSSMPWKRGRGGRARKKERARREEDAKRERQGEKDKEALRGFADFFALKTRSKNVLRSRRGRRRRKEGKRRRR